MTSYGRTPQLNSSGRVAGCVLRFLSSLCSRSESSSAPAKLRPNPPPGSGRSKLGLVELPIAIQSCTCAARNLSTDSWLTSSSPRPPRRLALALSPALRHRRAELRAFARSYEDDYEQETPRVRGIVHQPTRPVDKDKTEIELALHVKKAVSAEETAPKQKHVRSASGLPSGSAGSHRSPPCIVYAEAIVYSWDFRTSIPVWNAIRVQPVLADEIQTFKSLILVHKLLQEGHPIVRLPEPLSASI